MAQYNPAQHQPVLTVNQVAELHRVTTKTVRKWIKSGLLPAYRLPDGGLRIAEVDALAVGTPVETRR